MRVSQVADSGLASSGEPPEEFLQGQEVVFGGPRRNGGPSAESPGCGGQPARWSVEQRPGESHARPVVEGQRREQQPRPRWREPGGQMCRRCSRQPAGPRGGTDSLCIGR
uniref:Uncharacterized protein n=1 Tax=Micrurus lemniscatus lemniscatus TaxID=129467 RepID=A0A2D4JDH8_MICLE